MLKINAAWEVLKKKDKNLNKNNTYKENNSTHSYKKEAHNYYESNDIKYWIKILM